MNRFLLTFSLLLLGSNAGANTIVTNISGASGYVLGGSPKGLREVSIFGGIAGRCDSSSGVNTDGTCNSCQNASLGETCNERRIDATGELAISLYSSSLSKPGLPVLMDMQGRIVKSHADSDMAVARNQMSTIAVPWSDICASVTSDATCQTSGAGTFVLGYDQNASGQITSQYEARRVNIAIFAPDASRDATTEDCSSNGSLANSAICHFQVIGGINRVFLNNVIPGASFPQADVNGVTNVKMNGLVLFYSTKGFQDVGPSSPHVSLPLRPSTGVSLAGQISSQISLPGSHDYFFRIGTVDEANNVGFLTSDAAVATNCGNEALTATKASSLANCPYVAHVKGQLRP